MMEKVRWGIIGCGNVTEVKSGPGFQKAEGSELVAVMRRNGALAADYAARHGVAKWYDDADKLIADPEVDAVYVATPPSSHMEYALKCAAAGKPVYVEKPMARNAAECEEMERVCREAGVPLFVAYYRRGLDYFKKIKELLDGGAIGEARFVSMKQYQPARVAEGEALPWRLDAAEAGGGLFVDLASHTLDVMDYLLGPVRDAKGGASNQAGLYEVEDIVTGSFEFESGVRGVGVWCFSAYKHVDENEIVGDKGRIEFSTFGNEVITLETAEGVEEFRMEKPLHIQQNLIQLIVDELRGGPPSPSTGESGIRTNRVMDALLLDYYRTT
ncbi:Gfo/Idh/MocA family oxidoreductase [Paenibacillus sp. LHD-117]|uniref:Gfo/Idh/MocA family protein n=1 Tax=Paenibacillus sp. LHD-117 TaxID=3071412 RepID=UPI0027E179DE|nr:Gfo/Idh/MocA family oxidoreductase [Paenibacillus sp. LHD-117]MDQ6421230.1 Gfo/Idh/MocA family oxidoreductase [Paenibacillus sp. LHD-117]